MEEMVRVRIITDRLVVATSTFEFQGQRDEVKEVSESDYRKHLADCEHVELVTELA
jgi:hypothetical protein